MKANRKTMLGVALAVAVIALAGIGYALGYQAYTETKNNNTIGSEYVTIVLDDDDDDQTATAAYDGRSIAIEYNTKHVWDPDADEGNGAMVTKYQLNKTTPEELNFYIDVDSVNVDANAKYTLTVDGLSLFTTQLKGATASWSILNKSLTSGTSIEITNLSLDDVEDAVLTLAIAPTTEGEPGSETNIWFTEAPTSEISIGVITFTLTHQE